MNKSVKCTVLCVVMVCCMVFSLPLTTLAADSYQMNINEPAKGDNQGYILLLCQYPTGSTFVQCISWTMVPIDTSHSDELYSSDDLAMFINISSSSNTVSFFGFTSNNVSGNIQYNVGFGRCLSGDSLRTSYWNVLGCDSLETAYVYSLGSSTLLGYQIYGDAIQYSSDVSTSSVFSVTWGDDANLTSKLTELIALSTTMCENDEDMLSQLAEILGDTDAILTNTADIERLCTSIISWLSQMDVRLKVIQDNTDKMNTKLDKIIEILSGSGESTFEEPDTSAVDDYNKSEDELLSGAEDTSDIEQQIEDFEIDAKSSSLIWSIIQGFLNQNELVFGLVIGVLCLGIIALILNR